MAGIPRMNWCFNISVRAVPVRSVMATDSICSRRYVNASVDSVGRILATWNSLYWAECDSGGRNWSMAPWRSSSKERAARFGTYLKMAKARTSRKVGICVIFVANVHPLAVAHTSNRSNHSVRLPSENMLVIASPLVQWCTIAGVAGGPEVMLLLSPLPADVVNFELSSSTRSCTTSAGVSSSPISCSSIVLFQSGVLFYSRRQLYNRYTSRSALPVGVGYEK